MSKPWPRVRFGDIMRRNSRPYTLGPEEDANLIGMRLYGGGPFHRELKPAMQIAKKSHFVINAGDVIYNKLFAWKGTFGIVPKEFDGMFVSDKFPTYELDRSCVDEIFLRLYFRCPPLWEEARMMSTGSAALSKLTLNPPKFLLLTMPLPPLAEQRRIVARIEELAAQMDGARALRQEAAEETEALPLAELNAVFQQQAENFGLMRLEELLDEAGYGSSEKCESERMEGGSPVLRIPNVALERITLKDLKYARLNERDSQRLKLSEGDILVVRTNGSLDLVGRSAVVPKLTEPFAFASYMIRLRFDHKRIAPDYAQRMLQHLRVAGVLVDFARTTAGQYNVSLSRLRSAEIPVPPLSEQHRVVVELDAMKVAHRVLETHPNGFLMFLGLR